MDTTYKAIVTYLPIPPLKIDLEGDSNRIKTFKKTIRLLAHVARWTNIAKLTPSPNRQLADDAVELRLYQSDRLLKDEPLQLHYENRDQQWYAPRFKAKLINHTHQPLYCTVLDLTEEYSVSAPFFNNGGTWLAPHSEVFVTVAANDQLSEQIATRVPQQLWEAGTSEYRDTLKLIASTTEFDPRELSQDKIGEAIANSSISELKGNLFGQFVSQTASRDVGIPDVGIPKEAQTIAQWMTSHRTITTVRPQPSLQISSQQSLSLNLDHRKQSGKLIAILPHPQLQAKAKLVSDRKATRSLNAPALPSLLNEHTQPLTFTAHRSIGHSVGALQLDDIHHAAAVTPDYPLTLIIDAQLAPGEAVLPVAHDGEFYIPLGYGYGEDHKTKVVLQQLPQIASSAGPDAASTRTISSALQIIFRKVATQTLGESLSQKLGISYEYPILAAVEKGTEKGELVKTTDFETVRDRVANANSIAIYIHGITDSTQTMVPSLQNDCITVANTACSVGDVYDLVLTYDYESVNTPIAISALQLKQKLATVGITPGHGKTVHIVAHSMGGLVSRWLIEKEDGDQIVQHLIMLGTPNAGSPWAVVQAGLFKALGFAINGLSTVAWPLQIINGVLHTLEKIDIALDEMNPGSAFLTQLAASEPPIPYSIVAGNTSLIPVDKKAPLRARLEQRIDQLAEIPFLKEDNDIAVSVSSICHVPAGPVHRPQVRIVACDHLAYFVDPAGLAGLSWAINRALERKETLPS
ncbi:MAG: hypothetical protein AAFN40_27085 [Cyanobacteria bacterium J06560_6]